MAVETITGAHLTVNSVDLTAYIEGFTLTVSVSDSAYATFASDWQQQAAGGMKSGSLQINWKQDFAANKVDATLQPAIGTVVTFVAKKDAGAVAATNPSYSGSVKISEYTPLNPQHGQIHGFATTWPTSGTITRATS